ncbi:alpha/beta hydrolase [Massilia terrae]|uniref:Alpha/beta hydrolase n=1 Tax=Massilia terrae TaxID=1811224 RepID=A0ABT2D381_9BURK|nr:alpha/beta hydrolase [Massilia terrae]MCS0660490.1 alpha/beta hydrolase [Massilia terrae]
MLPLVLLPGYMLDETLWDAVAGQLGAPTYRLPLAPGDDIDAIAHGIANAAPERFVLAGFSLGGYVARKVAELYPQRVAALILIATSLRDDTEERATARRKVVQLMNADSFRGLSTHSIASSLHPGRRGDKELLARIRAMGERLGYQALVTQSNLRRDGIAAATLSCPTLVIAAAEDELRSAEESRELAAAIPNATLKVIEDSGHLIPIEQPDALAATVRAWLGALHI